MSTELTVVTLNAWGLPFPIVGSADRSQRMQHIGREFATGKYDLVALQEV